MKVILDFYVVMKSRFVSLEINVVYDNSMKIFG